MRATTIFLPLVVALALVGCGGDDSGGDSSTTTEPERLTSDEFVVRADKICVAARTADEELVAPDIDPSLAPSGLTADERNEYADYVSDSIDLARATYNGLRALRPPEDLQATFDEYLESARAQLTYADEAIDALRAGDDAAFDEARTDAAAVDDDVSALADDLGFEECSQS